VTAKQPADLYRNGLRVQVKQFKGMTYGDDELVAEIRIAWNPEETPGWTDEEVREAVMVLAGWIGRIGVVLAVEIREAREQRGWTPPSQRPKSAGLATARLEVLDMEDPHDWFRPLVSLSWDLKDDRTPTLAEAKQLVADVVKRVVPPC
jgi:hypothetical protein